MDRFHDRYGLRTRRQDVVTSAGKEPTEGVEPPLPPLWVVLTDQAASSGPEPSLCRSCSV
jgi:hypothetical protein